MCLLLHVWLNGLTNKPTKPIKPKQTQLSLKEVGRILESDFALFNKPFGLLYMKTV
jgi:hypothetical protein